MTEFVFSSIKPILTQSFLSPPLCSHLQVPTTILLKDAIRIFFSSRDPKGESLIYFIDVDSNDPQKVISENRESILQKGDVGFFDENGLMPSSILKRAGSYYLFYSGWSRRASSPYANYTGLAKSNDARTFSKACPGPVLSQLINDPLSATSPCVVEHKGRYLMFYCSGMKWIKIEGKLEHTYDIKLALSNDLVTWKQGIETIIAQSDEFDAITRPWIFSVSGLSFIFYCRRSSLDFRDGEGSYRVYYRFINLDTLKIGQEVEVKFGLDKATVGFDTMQCYPCVQTVGNKHFLFLNGNGFGKNNLGFSVISIKSGSKEPAQNRYI